MVARTESGSRHESVFAGACVVMWEEAGAHAEGDDIGNECGLLRKWT